MRRAGILAALLALATPTVTHAQGALVSSLSPPATAADVSAVLAAIPQPAAAVPPTEAIGGAIGTAGTYRPANAVQPRITRAGLATTDVSGNWSITWSAALAAAPVALPIPVNASAQPVVCNVATSTATGATGRCWLSRTLPASLALLSALVSYDLFGAAASGISVQVLAIPMTQ